MPDPRTMDDVTLNVYIIERDVIDQAYDGTSVKRTETRLVEINGDVPIGDRHCSDWRIIRTGGQ